MKTSSGKSWELRFEYVRKYMTHHVPEMDIKEKIPSENTVLSNIKGTPSIDRYIKQLLVENTLN